MEYRINRRTGDKNHNLFSPVVKNKKYVILFYIGICKKFGL